MYLRGNNFQLKNPTLSDITLALDKLDGTNNGYLILENQDDDYVQCAGHAEKLVVEYRHNLKPKFKHYVIGIADNKIPNKVSWVSLQTAVGQIMVRKEEVLNINAAFLIFKEFYENNRIPLDFKKRNVTKLHK